jgi:hypothetical protein
MEFGWADNVRGWLVGPRVTGATSDSVVDGWYGVSRGGERAGGGGAHARCPLWRAELRAEQFNLRRRCGAARLVGNDPRSSVSFRAASSGPPVPGVQQVALRRLAPRWVGARRKTQRSKSPADLPQPVPMPCIGMLSIGMPRDGFSRFCPGGIGTARSARESRLSARAGACPSLGAPAKDLEELPRSVRALPFPPF